MPDLQRFLDAQDRDPGGYVQALGEMRAGRKLGHWIWYVFPQLRGLGSSSTSQFYGLDGGDEARAYLRDAALGPRLATIAEVVAGQLERGVSLPVLMGSEIDATKLISSMTLFEAVASGAATGGEGEVAGRVSRAATAILARAASQGYDRCQRTLAMLSQADAGE